jgi:hypothetical protein
MITCGESWGHLGQIETKISVGNHRQLSRRPKLDFDQIDIRSILHFLLSDFRRIIFVSSSQFKSKMIIYGESLGHLGQIETKISMCKYRQLSGRPKWESEQNEIWSILHFLLSDSLQKNDFYILESQFKSNMISCGEIWCHLGQIETKIFMGNHRQLSRRSKLDFGQNKIWSIFCIFSLQKMFLYHWKSI